MTPTFFLDTSHSLTDFCRLSENERKINVGIIIFFNFTTPARSNSTHFEALRVWKCNYLKLVFPKGTSKGDLYLFNRSPQINFGNASLLPGFVHNIFAPNSRWVGIERRGPISQNKRALSAIISSKQSR